MEQSRAFRLYSQTEEQFYISPDNSEEDCTDLTSYDLGDIKNPPQPKVADGCGGIYDNCKRSQLEVFFLSLLPSQLLDCDAKVRHYFELCKRWKWGDLGRCL